MIVAGAFGVQVRVPLLELVRVGRAARSAPAATRSSQLRKRSSPSGIASASISTTCLVWPSSSARVQRASWSALSSTATTGVDSPATYATCSGESVL